MRFHPSASEAALFRALSGKRLGVVFRRQVVVGHRFILDLFAPAVGLAVEVDGPYHERRAQADARRDRALRRLGVRVLRVREAEVLRELPLVLERIRRAVAGE
jgi:very-short-patch-repair endonuclease